MVRGPRLRQLHGPLPRPGVHWGPNSPRGRPREEPFPDDPRGARGRARQSSPDGRGRMRRAATGRQRMDGQRRGPCR
eukprot:15480097-Alexandrium_andersonii.AAC.1